MADHRPVAVPDDDLPAFSRGIAGPLGKLDHDLKTKVDEHTHTLFLQQCAMRGIDPSCALRDCVYVMVHGKSYRQMVVEKVSHDEKRIEALTKLIGHFGAPEFSGAQAPSTPYGASPAAGMTNERT